jgi:hypothetical protein
MKKILIIIIFSLLLMELVSAKSSSEFLDYLTDVVYEGCERYDLELNNNENLVFVETESGKIPLNKVPWPYTKDTLKEIIKAIDFYEYAIIRDGWIYGNIVGYSLIWCTSNRSGRWGIVGTLDNDGVGYLWDGERVEMPKEEIKTTYGDDSPIIETGDNSPVITGDNSQVIETKGDYSPITTGDNSPINQKIKEWFVNIYINNYITINIVISLSLLLNFYFIFKLFKRKNSKKIIKQPIEDKTT